VEEVWGGALGNWSFLLPKQSQQQLQQTEAAAVSQSLEGIEKRRRNKKLPRQSKTQNFLSLV
jgi:hypothetical protein